MGLDTWLWLSSKWKNPPPWFFCKPPCSSLVGHTLWLPSPKQQSAPVSWDWYMIWYGSMGYDTGWFFLTAPPPHVQYWNQNMPGANQSSLSSSLIHQTEPSWIWHLLEHKPKLSEQSLLRQWHFTRDQSELLFHEILRLKEPLVDSLAFYRCVLNKASYKHCQRHYGVRRWLL